jgi:hypothetical protein
VDTSIDGMEVMNRLVMYAVLHRATTTGQKENETIAKSKEKVTG